MSLQESTISLPLLSSQEAGKSEEIGLVGEGGKPNKVSCDVTFLRRFFRLLRLINAWPALILVVLSIGKSLLVAQVGKVIGKYYAIFINEDQDQFLHVTLVAVGIYIPTTAISSTMDWLAEFLALRWRKKLTLHLQEAYCRRKNFYYLKSIDNPDQRMAQDASLFCYQLGQVAKVVAAMPFGVVLYTYLTYKLTHSLAIVSAAYASFLGSLIILKFFVSPTAKFVFKQEIFEGDLRMAFIRLRNRGQDIAILQGEEIELVNLVDKLKILLKYQLKVVMWHWLLSACIQALDYWGAILTYLCVGVMVFRGKLKGDGTSGGVAAKVSNLNFYLMTLIYSFTQVQDVSKKMSDLVGLTPRLSELLEAFDVMNSSQTKGMYFGVTSENAIDDCKDGAVRFESLTCESPTGEKIVDNFSLELDAGESLLVTGSNGCGKTTLMTVIMKLRQAAQGRIESCSLNSIIMLSQVPLFAPGKLLGDQLTYPSPCSLDTSEVIGLLELVGLGGVWRKWVGGDLSQERDWEKILSPGEIQRISIGRVFHHRPRMVILDEATSSMTGEGIDAAYTELKARGVTIISTSHNRELLKFHKYVLKLHGAGEWEIIENHSIST